jgi:hypothetical protein
LIFPFLYKYWISIYRTCYLLALMISCLFTLAPHAVASGDCSFGGAERAFTQFSGIDHYPFGQAVDYMRECYFNYGRQYKTSTHPTELKNSMQIRDVYDVMDNLIKGEVTTRGADEGILQNTKAYARKVFAKCSQHQTYIDASAMMGGATGDTPTDHFVRICGKSFILSRIDFTNVTSTLSPLAGDEAACASGVARNALSCARLCSDAGRPSAPACSNFNDHGGGRFADLARACAGGNEAACQQACDMEPLSCSSFIDQGFNVASREPPAGDDGDDRSGTDTDTDAGGTPISPIAETPSQDDETTADPADELPALANTLGNMMMPMMNQGGNMNATNVPKSDPGSGMSASQVRDGGAANPNVTGPNGTVHFPASANLPPQLEGFPRGGRQGDNSGGGAGPGAGGMPMMGGMMGGAGGGAGAAGAGPKGGGNTGGGGRSSALRPIADGMGGNNFMGTSGGVPPTNLRLDEKQKAQQNRNNKSGDPGEGKDPRAQVNAALRRNLERAGSGFGGDLAPNNYFPSVSEVYQGLRQKGDVID